MLCCQILQAEYLLQSNFFSSQATWKAGFIRLCKTGESCKPSLHLCLCNIATFWQAGSYFSEAAQPNIQRVAQNNSIIRLGDEHRKAIDKKRINRGQIRNAQCKRCETFYSEEIDVLRIVFEAAIYIYNDWKLGSC